MTRPCDVSECVRKHYAGGLCRPHWERQRRTGDPQAALPVLTPSPLPEAFAENGLSARRVMYLVEAGHIRPRIANGRRVWPQREIATGVLIHKLYAAGLRMELAAHVARRYCYDNTRNTIIERPLRGLELRLNAPTSKQVGT